MVIISKLRPTQIRDIKMKKIVFLIIPVLIYGIVLITGCENKGLDLERFDNIIGCWANPVYEYDVYPDAVICYKRVETLPDGSPSIQFLNDGTLIERKNAGWCGTPPITYSDFSGKWKIKNNNDLNINVAYWGGTEQKIWKIIDVTDTSLRIEINVENIKYN